MKALQIAFLLCLSIHSYAQVKNDLQRQNLKGKIKTLTEYEYQLAPDRKDSLKWKAISNFDEKGNIIGFATYSEDQQILSRSVYNYNDSGRLVDVQRFRADGILNAKTIYKYD